MSAEQQIVERITSAGTAGIKKIDLRKEFQDMEIDVVIEGLVTSGDILVDKKVKHTTVGIKIIIFKIC